MATSAKEGDVSKPIRGPDGYYIFKIDQILYSPIISQTDRQNKSGEIKRELLQYKADRASDEYVDNLLKSENPIIKRNAFSLLAGYIGSMFLSSEKLNELEISKFLMTESGPINASGVLRMRGLPLIKFNSGEITLGQFLDWFELRSFNFKFSQSNKNSFLRDVESYVWRMLRDQLLVRQAQREGMYSDPVVRRQTERWNRKLSALAMIEKLVSEIKLDTSSMFNYFVRHYAHYKITGDTISDFRQKYDDLQRDYLDYSERERLLHTVILLSRRYPVRKYYSVVDKLALPDQIRSQPIEVEYYKTGGTFPRKAFPTIEQIWNKIIF
ncbi:MAG: hypothetical protein ACP5ON_10055 [Bacteroidota bacterium]